MICAKLDVKEEVFIIENKAYMTNYYCKTKSLSSEIHFQILGKLHYEINEAGDNSTIDIIFYNTVLNFQDETRHVEDGLINSINVMTDQENVKVHIFLNNEADFVKEEHEGVPNELVLSFDRNVLKKCFDGKILCIIPSEDLNVSPTKLIEHNAMEKITKKLTYVLEQMGCKVTSDVNDDVSILLAASHEKSNVTGYRVIYNKNEKLADCLYKNLQRKLPLDGRGKIYSERQKDNLVRIEVGNINNRLDDAHFRSQDYVDKVIEGIFNGLLCFFSSAE